MAFYFIDIFSNIRLKDIELFAELYQTLSTEFSHIIKPNNDRLASLLYYKGLKFKQFKPQLDKEEIINLYSKESPLYYIAWDKFDGLKYGFPNLEVNSKINSISPLDCAIKYGSELCFNYLRNQGAKYTAESSRYAIQSGNQNIFSQMLYDGQSFDNMIDIALDYHNFEIAEYLKSNLGQVPSSIAESMYYGNYDIASYLLTNGANINKAYNNFRFISINVSWNSTCFSY
ncbi:hypothetical protein TVAG_117820 [Trichomonas vaginalis G3]|uniref:DUF3447 domain-containing protein n=1 Tax=Trichomonas vaginalis (strain ATCC PRA-98 / G3) TaxID=412133 RepID=A2EHW9_TRIV3|nr:spectrin binding [Trichomonas vaginalis G3]EAY07701.1 hypothetical protein TVAG_117820 [Trichomonas vaginalis G3]KAI5542211.1 spectrin binding [Trichomonas vaginalis G3]|eukprot:XP_001319924.1 hypothetical protein [Trichomonas vaginalis G3]